MYSIALCCSLFVATIYIIDKYNIKSDLVPSTDNECFGTMNDLCKWIIFNAYSYTE